AAKSGREYDAMHENDGDDDGVSGAAGVRENSRRAYFKEFKKVVDAADVILEVPLQLRTRALIHEGPRCARSAGLPLPARGAGGARSRGPQEACASAEQDRPCAARGCGEMARIPAQRVPHNRIQGSTQA